jgi:hypothetical protein
MSKAHRLTYNDFKAMIVENTRVPDPPPEPPKISFFEKPSREKRRQERAKARGFFRPVNARLKRREELLNAHYAEMSRG